MSKPPEPLMDKATMKRMLSASADAPVNCAFGLAKDGALILLDKIKSPKALEKDVAAKLAKTDPTRFGTARLAADDETLIRLTVNRNAPGAAKRLARAMKTAGIRHVELLDDAGQLLDGASDEEGAEASVEGAADATSHPEPAPAAAAPVLHAAMPDRDALRSLVERIGQRGLPAQEKAKLSALTKLLNEAMVAGDAAKASTIFAAMSRALLDAPSEASLAPVETASRGDVHLGKMVLAWAQTRSRVDGEINKLRAVLQDRYRDRGLASYVSDLLDSKVATLFDWNNDQLRGLLDQAANEADPTKRKDALHQANGVIKTMMAKLETPEAAKLDDNPAQKVAAVKLMSATLAGLSAALG